MCAKVSLLAKVSGGFFLVLSGRFEPFKLLLQLNICPRFIVFLEATTSVSQFHPVMRSSGVIRPYLWWIFKRIKPQSTFSGVEKGLKMCYNQRKHLQTHATQLHGNKKYMFLKWHYRCNLLKTKIIHIYTFKALMLSSFVCFILIPCECESSFLLFHLNWEVLMIFGFLAEAVFIRSQAD